jgi:hypothetical protein
MYNGIREDILSTFTLTLSCDGNKINYVTLNINSKQVLMSNVTDYKDYNFIWVNMDRDEIPETDVSIYTLAKSNNYNINCKVPGTDCLATYKDFLERINRKLIETVYSYMTPVNLIYIPNQEMLNILKQEFTKYNIKETRISEEIDTAGEINDLVITDSIKPLNYEMNNGLEFNDIMREGIKFNKYAVGTKDIYIKKFIESRRMQRVNKDF